ncbi:cytochrome P450 [Pyronema domesticum]|uniref:Similar to Isotrichodermin C-15 hydroxylase acc. no. O13317 n=1 Tax=Pyronema omphalodes (strain CBS 100304) TaxID=1076935 RepID=U4LUL2_PYROM|nr:cytochrome P450 [Pyronema domesticum]CCX31761.1 Similar to Isotrichodermin C-15 hydroxylase; acc. no. O13317 [Pyronema omphalodes CBS 100304]
MSVLSGMPIPGVAEVATLSLSAIRNGFVLLVTYLVTIVVYRLWFHPLAKYPGPLLARITDWNTAWRAWKGDRYLELYYAHQKYGPVVRVAPNMLSFNTATALKTIYGHTANAKNIQKGQFYTAFPAVKGVHNTHNCISKMEHGFKRRVLSVAFSDNALKSMEGAVIDAVNTLVDGVRKDGKNGVDMGERFSWLTFDVMAELCFGKSFGMLTDETQRFVTDLISKATHNHYICGNYLPIRFLNLGRFLFPTIARDRWRFIEHSRSCANERMALDQAAKKDFFYYLLNAKDSETGKGFSTKELWGEANVLMIAGSDTTATALSSTLYYLSRNPSALDKLRHEIRSTFNSPDEIVTGKDLADCHYLKACVDEGMRMAPPVSGLLPREALASFEVDGHVVPEGTVVGVPIYTIHHNPDYYPEPYQYRPERWLDDDQEQIEKAQSAFNPFSIGARGCIGKSVAYMELRLSIAKLVWEFEIRHKATEGKAELWDEGFAVMEGEYRLLDHFTCKKEGPVIEFTRREM